MEITLDMGHEYTKARNMLKNDIGLLNAVIIDYKRLHETVKEFSKDHSLGTGWLYVIETSILLVECDIQLANRELDKMPKQGLYTFNLRSPECINTQHKHNDAIALYMTTMTKPKTTVKPKTINWIIVVLVGMLAITALSGLVRPLFGVFK